MKVEEKALQELLEVMKTRDGWFVLDLHEATGIGPQLYVLLAVLEADGRVTSDWAEPEGPSPRRRRYSVAEGN